MFNITDDLILDISTNYISFTKGKKYYLDKRIKLLNFNKRNLSFSAVVSGTKDYVVKTDFDSSGNLKTATCSCPAYSEYWGYCKHIVAVLNAIKDRDKRGEFNNVAYSETAKDILDYFTYSRTDIKGSIELEVTYEYEGDEYSYGGSSSYVSFRVGEKKLYTVKNIKKLLESLRKHERLHYGKQFTLIPEKHGFTEDDQKIIDFLQEIYDSEMVLMDDYLGVKKNSLFKDKRILLPNYLLKRFFKMMEGREFNVVINNMEYRNVTIISDNLPIDFNLSKEDKALVLSIDNMDDFQSLTSDGEYFFMDGIIYKVSKKQMEYFTPIYTSLIRTRRSKLKFPEEYRERFISEVYPRIKNIGEVKVDEEVENSIYNPTLDTKIYLDKKGNRISARIGFIYGDIEINPFASREENNKYEDRILIRDVEKEKTILTLFEESEFKVKNNEVYLDNDRLIYDFILEKIPRLQKLSQLYYTESFKNIRVREFSSFIGGVRLNSESNMLEFSFQVDGLESNELSEMFKAIKEKKKYYRLKDGSFLPLNIQELNEIYQLMDLIDIGKKDFKENYIEIPKYRAMYLDEQLKKSGEYQVSRDLRFREFVQHIKEPQDIEYKIPQGLEGVLRNYQRFGFKWLKTLSYYGMGGILADDMGLGKTIQVLAYLLSEKEEKGAYPSLIIVPTSLLYNWQQEIEKFAPSLNTLVVSGNKDERQDSIDNLGDYDVIITSYPLIRRDIDLYMGYTFRACILDEAQHIKNPMSQSAKSVKDIRATNYFALTGTPIENSLTELWSIFDFIMPGYLLSHTKFMKKYERPIIKDRNKKVLDILGKHIGPFILRRVKKDVLKELPEKIEHKVVAELSHDQKKIYLAYLSQIKGEIEKEIVDRGFARSQIKILSGLTRLRQICCHPSLFIENFKGESGKLLLLEEILEDSLDGGHRILLFSQFTSMLAIIKDTLERKGIQYLYLDGSTDSKRRGELVRDFNEGIGDIFLISLKAGGTGLNLTGADTVIHFDPWWNPAVEEQATDRAHRIGQKKSVHVMKLIAKGTIEEKIYQLQEKKRKLIDSVIKPGETLVSKLSEEEIRNLFEM